jgi:hypothetical protein
MFILFRFNPCKPLASHQHGPSGLLLADLGVGDWFGGLLFSAGQQANKAVQDQLSALSFSRFVPLFLSCQLLVGISTSSVFPFLCLLPYLFLSNLYLIL